MGFYAATHFEADYRTGFKGYLRWSLAAAEAVTTTAIVDPAVPGGAWFVGGPCSMPAWTINDNMQPVESIGSSRDLMNLPYRRECEISTRFMVSSADWMNYIVRNRTPPMGGPGATDQRNGCYLQHVEVGYDRDYGIASDVGSTGDEAKVGLDALLNDVRFEYAENAPVTAEATWWPIALLPKAVAESSVAVTPGDILNWGHLEWLNAADHDYMSLLSRSSLGISNNLMRIGQRHQLTALTAAEPAISRTARKIIPGMEKLTVNLTLHDDLPSAMKTAGDWGTMRWFAEQPGVGAGRRQLLITVAHLRPGRLTRNRTEANAPVTYACDVFARDITITQSTT